MNFLGRPQVITNNCGIQSNDINHGIPLRLSRVLMELHKKFSILPLINSDCISKIGLFHRRHLCSNMSAQNSFLAFIKFIIVEFSWETVVLSPEDWTGFDVAFHFTSLQVLMTHCILSPGTSPSELALKQTQASRIIKYDYIHEQWNASASLISLEDTVFSTSWSKINVSCLFISGFGSLSSEGVFSGP